MRHAIFHSFTATLALFAFIAVMFMSASAAPVFAGSADEIKALEYELRQLNKELTRVKAIVTKMCKEDKESVDLDHYNEYLRELRARRLELTEKLAQLKKRDQAQN
jgi:hypothetical protein